LPNAISVRLCGSPAGIIVNLTENALRLKQIPVPKKRFKITGTGKNYLPKSFQTPHFNEKSKKRKRNMNKKGLVSAPNTDFVKRLLRLK